MSLTFTGLIGPIIGTVVYENIRSSEPNNFRYTNDIATLVFIIATIPFILFNCGCKVFKNNKI